jgi:glycosyltransferase involved in cell wall biosynthesis
MQLLILLESRFRRTPDGVVWTEAAYGPTFWQRYLAVFDQVQVLARVWELPTPPAGWSPAVAEHTNFHAVPHYSGPVAYLRRLREVRNAISAAYGRKTAVVMRVPSFLARHLWHCLEKNGHPYGLEVVGDPLDVFGPGVITHPLRPFLRWWMPRNLRQQCAQACAAAYVTDRVLQRRYPCPRYMTGVSDVDLSAEAFRLRPERRPGGLHLVTVASLEQPYKGIQHLLNAVARCTRMGICLRLTLVGGGRLRPELERQTESLGLSGRVAFLGHLPPGAAVRAVLDRADLFVLPSLTEGLPRAMIEAMARGLPCIGTTVGGIPELLTPENMVPAADVLSLAAKIAEVTGNPARMARMSEENLVRASEFAEHALRERRLEFYRHLRRVTEEWVAAGEPGGAVKSPSSAVRC